MLTPIAAVVLTAAVAGGALLAQAHARRRPVPFALGLIHAGVAATGLGLLTLAVSRYTQPIAVNAALLLFFIALIGGAFLLIFRLQKESPPGFMIVLHAGTAVTALALLWLGLTMGD
jgi:FtsH-binding integral membrane protein